MAIKSNKKSYVSDELKWPYGKINYIIFAAAILVIAIGFLTLSQGSETLAPILLVFGYLVLIPVSLLIKDKTVTEQSSKSEPTE